MIRIKKEVAAIADAHIAAKISKQFNPRPITDRTDLTKALYEGHTFEEVLDQVEARFCTVGSSILGSFGYASGNYKRDVRNGFKKLLQQVN